jgi:hypothetical protein
MNADIRVCRAGPPLAHTYISRGALTGKCFHVLHFQLTDGLRQDKLSLARQLHELVGQVVFMNSG